MPEPEVAETATQSEDAFDDAAEDEDVGDDSFDDVSVEDIKDEEEII